MDWYAPAIPYETRTAYIIPEAEMENFEGFLALHEKDVQLETQIGNRIDMFCQRGLS